MLGYGEWRNGNYVGYGGETAPYGSVKDNNIVLYRSIRGCLSSTSLQLLQRQGAVGFVIRVVNLFNRATRGPASDHTHRKQALAHGIVSN